MNQTRLMDDSDSDSELHLRLAAMPAKDRTLFVQLYRSSMRAMRGLAFEAPAAHGVLYVLLERMNQRNALVVSQATLCQITGKTRSTIQRALAELKKRNFVEIVRAGNIAIIIVNKRVAWTTHTALREKLATFDAQVIASASEQDDPTVLGQEPPLVALPPILIPPEIGSLLDDEDPTIAGQQSLPGV